MASKTLGRVACPVGCAHEAAQVKLKTDKEAGKTAFPYIHCAGCGIQLHTRSQEQAGNLLKMTRAEKAIDEPVAPEAGKPPAVVVVAPVVAQVPQKSPAPAGGMFAGLFAGVPA